MQAMLKIQAMFHIRSQKELTFSGSCLYASNFQNTRYQSKLFHTILPWAGEASSLYSQYYHGPVLTEDSQCSNKQK